MFIRIIATISWLVRSNYKFVVQLVG